MNNINNKKNKRSNSSQNIIMININKNRMHNKGKNYNNLNNNVINFALANLINEGKEENKIKSEKSKEEDLKFNNSFNAKGICLDSFRDKKNLIKNEAHQKNESKNNDDKNKENNENNNNNQNNSNQNNEENRANATNKPDNDKTDINFEDLTNTNNLNNNHTKSKGANPSSNASHRLSKKKSGIVISDDIDEDEEDADGVIFKNRGKLIFDKNNNISEETNHMF